APGISLSWRRSSRSRPPGGSRTSGSWSAWPGNSTRRWSGATSSGRRPTRWRRRSGPTTAPGQGRRAMGLPATRPKGPTRPTRPRERLYLCHAWCRNLFGSTQYNPASRFLAEVPEQLVRLTGRTAPGRGSVRERQLGTGVVGAPRGPGGGPVTGAAGAEKLGLRVGDDVAHEKFGEGVIIGLEGEGDKAEALVRFRHAGEKRLLLSWAPLKLLRG